MFLFLPFYFGRSRLRLLLGATFLGASRLLNGGEHAPENIHFHLIHSSSLEQPPQTRHKLARGVPATDIHIHENLLEVPDNPFSLTYRCRGNIPARITRRHRGVEVMAGLTVFEPPEVLHSKYVTQHLHSHGQI